MRKRIAAVLACLMVLLYVRMNVPASAWVADEGYTAASDLPSSVRDALPKDYVFLQALRGGQSVFVLMQESSEARRVLIFRQRNDDAYLLECVSAPLPEWNGDDATIGCSGDLYLFYEGNVNWIGTFQRDAYGAWRLGYIQGEDSFSIYPYGGYFWEEIIASHSVTRFAFGELETDLAKIDIATMPIGLSQALSTLNTQGYAMVANPVPTDRLHLRDAPSRDAVSLGKYYTGTPVRVLQSDGEWSEVTVLGVPGYMMTKYLCFGLEMSTIDQAYAQAILRFEDLDAGIQVFEKPDKSSPILGVIHDDRRTLLGTRIYGVIGEDWLHVYSDSGFAGYVEAQHFDRPTR